MSFRKRFAYGTLFGFALFGVAAGAAAAGAIRPEAVSPGELDRAVEMGDGCFGYSWAAVDGALGFELAVYRVDHDTPEAETAPSLSVRVPATLSWTPSLEKCLPSGLYAWVVRAQTAAGWTAWSEPRLFAVHAESTAGPSPGARRSQPSAAPAVVDGGSSVNVELQRRESAGPLTPGPPRPRTSTGEAFSPPACTSHFGDVGPSNAFCPWIEQLWRDQITDDQGCGGGNYCPKAPVTREQLALLLERSMRGTDTFRPGSTTADIPNRTPASATVTPLHTAGDVGKYSSITIGADGLGLISYWDGSLGMLRVAHCSNVDCSAATITPVDFAPFFTYYTSITIGADGFGLISYYDALSLDLKVAHCANAQCTAVDAATPIDTTGDVGQYTSITIGADGLGLISYYDATNQDLKVAHCANVQCTAADQITALDTADVGIYTSIAIGADGLGLISYQGTVAPDLNVAHCSNAACTAATITSIDAASDVNPVVGTSVTIGADSLGLVSYTDEFNNLKVAHCSNTNCTVAPFVTIGSGQLPSLTTGADGLGLIGYYDAGDLKVAHCSNANCTAATLTPLDTAGSVGKYASITIGADGLGLISYYDETNGDLKVAHCSNVLCAPYFRRR